MFPIGLLLIGGTLHLTPPTSSSAAARFDGEASEQHGWSAELRFEDRTLFMPAPEAAFFLAPDETLHPELPLTGWEVHYTSHVRIRQAGRYRFGLDVLGGEARLEVTFEDGSKVECQGSGEGALGPWVDLNRGAAQVDVRFRRSSGEARLRALWEMEFRKTGGFPLEPISSRVARVPAARLDALDPERRARRGRGMLTRLGCANCHAAPPGSGVEAPPAPDLSEARGRYAPDWLQRWIRSPRSIEPHPPMPELLGSSADPEEEALDLVHYLWDLAEPSEAELPLRRDSLTVRQGRELYHTLGCVACHGGLETPSAVFDQEFFEEGLGEAAVDPLDDLEGKWSARALADFLLDPRSVRPSGIMPDFGLEEDEAERLAAYLTERWSSAAGELEVDPSRVERGRSLFVQRSCVACHALDGVEAAPHGPPLAQLDPAGGCLDPEDSRSPRYDLEPAEREDLLLGLASVRATRGHPAPLDRAALTLQRFECRACHPMDGLGGPDEGTEVYFRSSDDRVDLGDEGRLPPNLTGVGAKLNTSWLHALLTEGRSARPYLAARMPLFGTENVEELARDLAQAQGVRPHSDEPEPEITDPLLEAGRELLGREALGCMACHVYKDFPPSGSPGPDVSRFAERLRYDWYRSFIQNPQRFVPGSRMPDFGTGGVSSLRSVLEGDMARQADALWSFFTLGDFMPPPPGVEAGKSMRILVQDEPHVLRSFLEDAGSRAVAVGLPVGVHFAFDASAVRLAYAWRGDYLDAAGSWAGRGGTPLGGQGPLEWSAPAGPAIWGRSGAPPEQWQAAGRGDGLRFRGYRLGPEGHPTFLYDSGPWSVAERVDARVVPNTVLQREFTLDGGSLPGEVWVNLGENAEFKASYGCRVEDTMDRGGRRWARLSVLDPSASFVLEVQP